LVLRFPAETSHCSIIAVRVQVSPDAEARFHSAGIRHQVVLEGRVRNGLDQAGAENGCRYAKDHVGPVGKVGLRDRARGRIVRTAGNCEDGLDASIESSGRTADEAYLPDGAVHAEERRNGAVRGHTRRLQDLGITATRWRTRSAECRLYMASATGIEIEPRPQTGRHILRLNELHQPIIE